VWREVDSTARDEKQGILLENVVAKEDQRPTVMWRSTAVDCQDAAKIVIFLEPSEIWDISSTGPLFLAKAWQELH
jgi:hypothetical protein